MKTIAVHKDSPCRCCGAGKELDHVATGKRAADLRHKAGLSQADVVKLMDPRISNQYLAFLELGKRCWTPKLIESFEKAVRK